MAAINMSLAARSEYALHQLVKREKNWAQREPGVIIVVVVVFLVILLVIAMFINKKVRFPPHTFPLSPHRAIPLTQPHRGKPQRPASLLLKIPPESSRNESRLNDEVDWKLTLRTLLL